MLVKALIGGVAVFVCWAARDVTVRATEARAVASQAKAQVKLAQAGEVIVRRLTQVGSAYAGVRGYQFLRKAQHDKKQLELQREQQENHHKEHLNVLGCCLLVAIGLAGFCLVFASLRQRHWLQRAEVYDVIRARQAQRVVQVMQKVAGTEPEVRHRRAVLERLILHEALAAGGP